MKKIFTVFILLITYHGFSQTNYVPNVTVSTFAGSTALVGPVDGQGTAASFGVPYGITLDTLGNMYATDGDELRKVTSGGTVTTFNNSVDIPFPPLDNINYIYNLNGVAVDNISGNLYIGDCANGIVREIAPGGSISTFAGSTIGNVDGQGTAASFAVPRAVAIDDTGNVYIADAENNNIRKITPGGLVSTIAGSGAPGSLDGQGTTATFNDPEGIAVDVLGNIYVSDAGNNKIRKIAPGGLVTTLAGSVTAGSLDGQGNAASFNYPIGIAVDASGNVYVADALNNKIRKIAPGGLVTTLAGLGTAGSIDGQGNISSFNYPSGVAIDSSGNVYVADYNNGEIRKITIGSSVTTASVLREGYLGLTTFPNPARDVLNIHFSDVVNCTLLISDAKGNMVLTQAINGKQVQLSTASLQNGIYVLSVVSDNASYVTRVVIAK